MSYVLLSLKDCKARKVYSCEWCGEPILVGDTYKREVSVYDEFQNKKWHPECWDAGTEYFADCRDDECEYLPGTMARGLPDEKGMEIAK
jgi:hypothetical protein